MSNRPNHFLAVRLAIAMRGSLLFIVLAPALVCAGLDPRATFLPSTKVSGVQAVFGVNHFWKGEPLIVVENPNRETVVLEFLCLLTHRLVPGNEYSLM